MGVSVSLLSVGTISFVGAVCFAAGYLFSAHSLRARPFNHADDDDDKETLKKSSIKGARRIFYIIHDMVRGKAGGKRKTEAMTVVDQKSKNKKHTLLEIESLAEIFEDFKMVLVVRNDLKMGKGKIAAQCSHATLGLYKKLNKRAPKALSRWEMCGQVKVVLRTESEEDMLVLQERAKSLKLPTHITIDAGRTQIAPNRIPSPACAPHPDPLNQPWRYLDILLPVCFTNSRTVMAILGPADVVDDVSGGLKLL